MFKICQHTPEMRVAEFTLTLRQSFLALCNFIAVKEELLEQIFLLVLCLC